MLPRRVGARSGLRGGFLSLLTVLSVLAVSSGTFARSHHQHADAKSSESRSSESKAKEAAGEEPRYSDIVVDGNTGAVLHASEPDALRHPASLTKIMTLYLLFEQLEAGKLKLDSWLEVSEHAAVQWPTKLGLRDGQTIRVEDAIKGIVTRSANDAAVVVAEAIGGDEETFAKLMTRKAQSLGMTHTVYHNASGLPADQQVTTARDQVLLGRAIQERFPRYYKYFSTRSFEFRGEEIGNHNRLLGSVEGVDGIKTGYIAASGFNIVTSVHRDNRYLLAVVFGGSSAGSRDQRVRELIHDHIAQASVQHAAPSLIAEAETKAQPAGRPTSGPTTKSSGRTAAKSGPYALASAGSVPFTLASAKSETKADVKTEAIKPDARTPSAAPANTVAITLTSKSDPTASTTVQVPRWAPAGAAGAPSPAPAVGSEDPIHPVPVHTVLVRPGAIQTAPIAPLQPPADAPVATAAAATAPTVTAPAAAAPSTAASAVTATPLPFPPPGTRPGAIGGLPSSIATASVSSAPSADITPTPPTPAPPPATSAPATPHAATPPAHSGWMIQVGAFPAEEEAKQRLSSVQSRASRYLATADAFTESVTKGDSILYRARFAGLGKEQAEAACKYLKRNDVDCMTIKN
jgi:D-alanyl-D-alanine carboxypeptidase